MQTRRKASKPYLLHLIDLGGKGEEKTRNKASMNDGYIAMLHSSFWREKTAFIEKIQQNINTQKSTVKPCGFRQDKSSVCIVGLLHVTG